MKQLSLLLFCLTLSCTADIYLLVPGTWAPEDGWHTQGSQFYLNLKSMLNDNDHIIPFYWRGRNCHESRVIAGEQLALLLNSFPQDEPLFIIAHSHGGNVVLLASQKITRSVDAVCLLGTPIDEDAYRINYKAIIRMYNIFSWEDLIQPVFGYFSRITKNHLQAANISVMLNGISPGHSDMHDPLLACHLPAVMKNSVILGAEIILACTNQSILLLEDKDRARLLEDDAAFLCRLNGMMRKKRTDEKKY